MILAGGIKYRPKSLARLIITIKYSSINSSSKIMIAHKSHMHACTIHLNDHNLIKYSTLSGVSSIIILFYFYKRLS